MLKEFLLQPNKKRRRPGEICHVLRATRLFLSYQRYPKNEKEKQGNGVGEGQQDAEQFVCGDLGDDIHD